MEDTLKAVLASWQWRPDVALVVAGLVPAPPTEAQGGWAHYASLPLVHGVVRNEDEDQESAKKQLLGRARSHRLPSPGQAGRPKSTSRLRTAGLEFP